VTTRQQSWPGPTASALVVLGSFWIFDELEEAASSFSHQDLADLGGVPKKNSRCSLTKFPRRWANAWCRSCSSVTGIVREEEEWVL
jgi:hypothetical protein